METPHKANAMPTFCLRIKISPMIFETTPPIAVSPNIQDARTIDGSRFGRPGGAGRLVDASITACTIITHASNASTTIERMESTLAINANRFPFDAVETACLDSRCVTGGEYGLDINQKKVVVGRWKCGSVDSIMGRRMLSSLELDLARRGGRGLNARL